MCHARLASYRTSSPHGLVCSQRLLNKLSTRREPGDRIPHSVITPSGDGYRTLGANNVYFVVLDGQQHSAHFNREAADDTAWELSYERNYLQHPEEGRSKISVLSFTEMMESPVEMVI
jgi:hypothetical protein